jgi:hypothetical protein
MWSQEFVCGLAGPGIGPLLLSRRSSVVHAECKSCHATRHHQMRVVSWLEQLINFPSRHCDRSYPSEITTVVFERNTPRDETSQTEPLSSECMPFRGTSRITRVSLSFVSLTSGSGLPCSATVYRGNLDSLTWDATRSRERGALRH